MLTHHHHPRRVLIMTTTEGTKTTSPARGKGRPLTADEAREAEQLGRKLALAREKVESVKEEIYEFLARVPGADKSALSWRLRCDRGRTFTEWLAKAKAKAADGA
jgi:hypothetical protein